MQLKEALSGIRNPIVLKFLIDYIRDETDWGPEDEVTDEMIPMLIRMTASIAEGVIGRIHDVVAKFGANFGGVLSVNELSDISGKGGCPGYDKETGLCKRSGEQCHKEGELITPEEVEEAKGKADPVFKASCKDKIPPQKDKDTDGYNKMNRS
jgi:hypothetical protein